MDAFFEQAFDLSGQVALVTGGGSGLGYATAKCLAAAGAKVVITGRREEVLAKACQKLGDRVCYYVHDVTDTDAAPTFIARVVDEQGGCDILVNNAGRHCKKPVEEITMQDFRDVMDVHLYGSFALSQAVIPYMRAKKRGDVSADGIRVNAIIPGFIDTPMFHQAVDSDLPRQQKILGHTPMGSYGRPEDIGWAAVYLCSNAASFVNGTSLTVDGGCAIGF